jgi:hypothetical protein
VAGRYASIPPQAGSRGFYRIARSRRSLAVGPEAVWRTAPGAAVPVRSEDGGHRAVAGMHFTRPWGILVLGGCWGLPIPRDRLSWGVLTQTARYTLIGAASPTELARAGCHNKEDQDGEDRQHHSRRRTGPLTHALIGGDGRWTLQLARQRRSAPSSS